MICLVWFVEKGRKASSICSKIGAALGPLPLLVAGVVGQMHGWFQAFPNLLKPSSTLLPRLVTENMEKTNITIIMASLLYCFWGLHNYCMFKGKVLIKERDQMVEHFVLDFSETLLERSWFRFPRSMKHKQKWLSGLLPVQMANCGANSFSLQMHRWWSTKLSLIWIPQGGTLGILFYILDGSCFGMLKVLINLLIVWQS